MIKNPKFSHTETKYTLLILVRSVSGDFDENNLLARPNQIDAGREGNVFVYENMLHDIFRFSRSLKYLGRFSQRGFGPGDNSGNTASFGEPNIRMNPMAFSMSAIPGTERS